MVFILKMTVKPYTAMIGAIYIVCNTKRFHYHICYLITIFTYFIVVLIPDFTIISMYYIYET
jgi:hypothetical protein